MAKQTKQIVEITNDEIKIYLKDKNEDFEGKLLKIIFGDLEKKLRENKFSIKLNTDEMDVDDGGSGFCQAGLIIPAKAHHYLQYIFIGYYFDEEEKGIKFLKKNIPEIVLFFGIEVEYAPQILADKDFCKKINELKKYGFENVLKDLENEQERPMFYKRKSITDFDKLNGDTISEFIEQAFTEICSVGLDKHIYFTDFGI